MTTDLPAVNIPPTSQAWSDAIDADNPALTPSITEALLLAQRVKNVVAEENGSPHSSLDTPIADTPLTQTRHCEPGQGCKVGLPSTNESNLIVLRIQQEALKKGAEVERLRGELQMFREARSSILADAGVLAEGVEEAVRVLLNQQHAPPVDSLSNGFLSRTASAPAPAAGLTDVVPMETHRQLQHAFSQLHQEQANLSALLAQAHREKEEAVREKEAALADRQVSGQGLPGGGAAAGSASPAASTGPGGSGSGPRPRPQLTQEVVGAVDVPPQEAAGGLAAGMHPLQQSSAATTPAPSWLGGLFGGERSDEAGGAGAAGGAEGSQGAREQAEALQAEVQALKADSRDLMAQLKRQQEMLAAAGADPAGADFQRKLAAVIEERDHLKAELGTAEKTVAALEDEVAMAVHKREAAEVREAAVAAHGTVTAKHQALAQATVQYQDRVHAQEASIEKLVQDCQVAKSEVAMWTSEVNKMRYQLQDAHAKEARTQRELSETRADLERAHSAKEVLEVDVAAQKAQLDDATSRLELALVQNEELRDQSSSLASKLGAADSQLKQSAMSSIAFQEGSSAEISELRRLHMALQVEHDTLQHAHADLEAAVAHVRAHGNDMEHEAEKAKAALSSMEKVADINRNRADTLDRELQAALRDNSELTRRLHEEQLSKVRAEQERDAVLVEGAAQGDKAARVADGLRVVRTHLQKENDALRAEAADLRRARDDHTASIQALKEEVARQKDRAEREGLRVQGAEDSAAVRQTRILKLQDELNVAMREKTFAVSAERLCSEKLREMEQRSQHLQLELEKVMSVSAQVTYDREKASTRGNVLEKRLSDAMVAQSELERDLKAERERADAATAGRSALQEQHAALEHRAIKQGQELEQLKGEAVVLLDQLAACKRMLDEGEASWRQELAALKTENTRLEGRYGQAKTLMEKAAEDRRMRDEQHTVRSKELATVQQEIAELRKENAAAVGRAAELTSTCDALTKETKDQSMELRRLRAEKAAKEEQLAQSEDSYQNVCKVVHHKTQEISDLHHQLEQMHLRSPQ